MNDSFPLGKPVNRPKPAEHKPEREEVSKGIFSVDGKLQTERPLPGPRYAPIPEPEVVEVEEAGDAEPDVFLPWKGLVRITLKGQP